MNNQNEILAKLANKLITKLTAIESIAVLFILTGLILKSFDISQGRILLLISLGTLSLVYFLLAYKSMEPDASVMVKFLNKLVYWAFSICVVGILFRIQNYPGYIVMINTGCMTLLLSIVISVMQKQNLGSKLIIRIIIIAAIGLCLRYTPKEKLIELKIIHPIEKTSNPKQ
ncbi:MAG TPA: hypothetical protein PKK00_09190 [Bacteroidales bacterium]|nr:hypothetical protein [Bacteroidales bacterium]HPS17072.1 hypothetical protein [Bacteroidales bacterium]